ncbi:MAG TPA: hypothetical protein VFS16_03670 [Acidimicrobiia bacterium]|nr:hypothetical protein [Acidimicrobiia bacterium]
MSQENAENLREALDERREEILDHVEKNSPRPSVDRDVTERLLDDVPPAEAVAEVDRMIDGFQSGAGAATGRRTEPATEEPPTDDLPKAG